VSEQSVGCQVVYGRCDTPPCERQKRQVDVPQRRPRRAMHARGELLEIDDHGIVRHRHARRQAQLLHVEVQMAEMLDERAPRAAGSQVVHDGDQHVIS
jgi:hypothetical protein